MTCRSTTAAASTTTNYKQLLFLFVIILNNVSNNVSLNLFAVDAKKVSGDFQLSGTNTEYRLTSFAVLPAGGRVDVQMYTKGSYASRMQMRLRLYRDVEWPKYLKALTCSSKIKLATQTSVIPFVHDVNETDSNKKLQAQVHILMFNDPDGSSKRPHYWYFVVDDCSLEQYYQDDKVPRIHYKIDVQNHIQGSKEVSHLSADEWYLTRLHVITFLVSGFVTCLLIGNAMYKLTMKTTGGTSSKGREGKSVHASVLWVAIAAALDAGSSLCEILHLRIYESNGTGSYIIDALAAHLEAVCDALILLLLLSIAAGWTLPSDVIAVNPNANTVQRLLQDLSHPLSNGIKKGNGFSGAGVLALLVIGSHVVLAQWGRTYNDEFESYHDFAHLPGKIMMMTRVVLGILFLAATVQTRAKCNVTQLSIFYVRLAVAGTTWFYSLPVLTWICNVFVPYYLRNPAVFIGSALAQSSSIVLLAWLVTSHGTSTYHHYSHMSTPSEKSLTESLSMMKPENSSDGGTEEPRTWKLGKAKVRLD